MDFNVDTPTGIVGKEYQVRALQQALQAAPGGCLGMWGIRGLGKTTLARALCASMQRSSPRICFIQFPSLEEPVQPAAVLSRRLMKEALRQLGRTVQRDAHTEASAPAAAIACQAVTAELQTYVSCTTQSWSPICCKVFS